MPADRRVGDIVGGSLVAELGLDRFPVVALPPRLAEYQQLRALARLDAKSDAQAIGALRGSWAVCHVRAPGGDPVAMGRVIGDGGWHFTIVDIATRPGYRRRGLGGYVVDWLLDRIRLRAPDGAYVTLVTDPAARRLYERAGFREVLLPHGVALQMVLGRG